MKKTAKNGKSDIEIQYIQQLFFDFYTITSTYSVNYEEYL